MVNLTQARDTWGRLLSEVNQENWCSVIEGLAADNTIADAIDTVLTNCMPSNVLALHNRGMRRFFRLPEGWTAS